jgi:hypothetical protein
MSFRRLFFISSKSLFFSSSSILLSPPFLTHSSVRCDSLEYNRGEWRGRALSFLPLTLHPSGGQADFR